MSLERLLELYGYPVLFLGTIFEGETPLLLAGFLAHRGYFSLPLVGLVALAGTITGDQLFFQLGRRRGPVFLTRRPSWQPRVARAEQLLARYGDWIVIGFRFAYGFRTVVPLVVGASGFPARRFAALNAVGGALWTLCFCALGYSVGNLLALFFTDADRYERPVLAAMLLTSALVWAALRLRRRTRAG